MALIDIFKPGQENNVQVLAFNGAFDGPPSNLVDFKTPEDIYPDPPSFIWTRVTNQNNKAVIRLIPQPNNTNENPGEKLYIQYRKQGNGSFDQWVNMIEENPEDAKQPVDLLDLEFDTFYEVRVLARSGEFESFINISIIDNGSKKWPRTTTTTTTVPTTESRSTPPLPLEVNYPTESRKFDPIINIGDQAYTDKTKTLEDEVEEGEEGNNFAKTPWFIALLIVLAFICAFVGVFVFIKTRRNDEEVKRNSRIGSDKIRDPKNNSEPNESNHFIADIDNNANNARNGSVGHDEGDSHNEEDYEDSVYKKTTVPRA